MLLLLFDLSPGGWMRIFGDLVLGWGYHDDGVLVWHLGWRFGLRASGCCFWAIQGRGGR